MEDLKFLATQDSMGLHHVLCCDPSWNGFVQAFLDIWVPLLGWSDEPNEEHTGEVGWAGMTLQPPTSCFSGFCDVVKVTTFIK
jgi:hypothetical protein